MFRRQFVQFFAALSASSVAGIVAADPTGTESVTYVVKGFSCVTCAVGLDTTLQRRKGIASSQSTYPEGVVKIKFDPRQVSEETIQSFIGEMGFTVSEKLAS